MGEPRITIGNGSLVEGLNYFTSQERGTFTEKMVYYTTLINIAVICTALSSFGIITNVINLLVFKRQGFKETVNIALFATAVSDLISSLATLWVAICYNPLLLTAELPFLPLEVQYLTGELPHVTAMGVTGWLTAYVTLERCICVAFPLKVKDIFTTARTKVFVIFTFVTTVVLHSPAYWAQRLKSKFDPQRNRSVIGYETLDEYWFLESIAIYIVNVFGPVISFFTVVACTAILIINLGRKSKWRQQSVASTGSEEEIGKRDRKVIKMIIAVAVVFIGSNVPAVVLFLLVVSGWDLSPSGTLANNYFVSVSFAFVFEAINASVNIFVYYNMSSKYKANFHIIIFGKQEETMKC